MCAQPLRQTCEFCVVRNLNMWKRIQRDDNYVKWNLNKFKKDIVIFRDKVQLSQSHELLESINRWDLHTSSCIGSLILVLMNMCSVIEQQGLDCFSLNTGRSVSLIPLVMLVTAHVNLRENSCPSLNPIMRPDDRRADAKLSFMSVKAGKLHCSLLEAELCKSYHTPYIQFHIICACMHTRVHIYNMYIWTILRLYYINHEQHVYKCTFMYDVLYI